MGKLSIVKDPEIKSKGRQCKQIAGGGGQLIGNAKDLRREM